MSKNSTSITFGASVSMATEIAIALMKNTFVEWYESNYPIVFSDDWDSKAEERLEVFSKTIRDLRVTEIIPSSRPIQDFYPELTDDGGMVRCVTVTFGNKTNKSLVAVRIHLMRDDSEFNDTTEKWEGWVLAEQKPITIAKHTNSNYCNKVLL